MIGEKEIKKGSVASLTPGTILYVLTGKYPYKIRFNSEGNESSSSPSPQKKSITDFFGSSSNKRKARDEEVGSSEAKRARVSDSSNKDDSDESMDEETKEIQRKLKAFQSSASPARKSKKDGNNDRDSKNGSSSSSGDSGMKKRGSPNTADKWEQHDTLLMFTGKDVQASSKVNCSFITQI